FTTTRQLAGLAERVIRGGRDEIHPATRVFQALRIAVNGELDELAAALVAAERVLRPGGRLVVVTFHSLEDRMVKRFLAERSAVGGGSRHAPAATVAPPSFRLLGRSAVTAGADELAANPRSRSAKLRAAERLDAVVSTDGDGDRPLVVDEAGNQINGDILGALTARELGIPTIVTPLTSTSALELSG
ncbi:16S rRNA (cytosine(1402)-N(4))-methyltransferase, partial [Mycobacterium tuberculosis]|nr:16S rRNA (cytosine(1402)-N(4))-methyltransferase [Mycobacterium tuberculosis]